MELTYDVTAGAGPLTLAPRTELEEILQNIRVIVSTMKGSVPLDRAFGINPDVVDMPILQAKARVTEEIIRAIRTYEPRARINKVGFAGNPDGRLIPKVNVTILLGR